MSIHQHHAPRFVGSRPSIVSGSDSGSTSAQSLSKLAMPIPVTQSSFACGWASPLPFSVRMKVANWLHAWEYRHTMVCSQVDILPTIAGITGIPYTNTAMGRDLLHLQDTNSNTAFFIDHDVRNIGVVHGSYMMQRNLANNAEQLVPIYSNDPIPADSVVSLSADMRKRISAFYETARYMLFNNGNKHK